MRSILIGMAAADPSPKRPSAEQIDIMVQSQAEELQKQAQALARLGTAHTYRNAPLEDLKAYAAFLRSPVGTKFYEQSSIALNATLSAASARVGEITMKEIARQKS